MLLLFQLSALPSADSLMLCVGMIAGSVTGLRGVSAGAEQSGIGGDLAMLIEHLYMIQGFIYIPSSYFVCLNALLMLYSSL